MLGHFLSFPFRLLYNVWQDSLLPLKKEKKLLYKFVSKVEKTSFNDLDEKSISTLTHFWCIPFPQLAVLSTWCCQHAPDYLTLLKNIDWSNKYALSIKKLLLMFLMEKKFFFYFNWFLVLCHFTKLLFCLLNKVIIPRLSFLNTKWKTVVN